MRVSHRCLAAVLGLLLGVPGFRRDRSHFPAARREAETVKRQRYRRPVASPCSQSARPCPE